jgi:PAS domain S-box-containing protein
LFGYSAHEVIGRSIRIIIPADRQSEEDEVLARIGRGETIEHFETIRRRKDGSMVPISLTVSPVRNETGQIVGISKIARDLSERRKAEHDLETARTSQADLQRRLTMLVAASGSLLISPRVEDVLPASVNLAIQLLEADGCAVWRLAKGAWRIGAAQGVSDGFAGRVITSGTDGGPVTLVGFTDPLAVEDTATHPLLSGHRDAYAAEGIRSMLAVPLRIGRDLSGTLVSYYRDTRNFTGVEIETARALGNLVSAAVTTAELYDAQRRSREQSELLSEATAALAASLDYHVTLTRIAHLAVPQMADWCAVDLENEQGEVERLAVAHLDPLKIEMARQFQERYPPDPSSPYDTHHVLRTGAPVLVPEVTDAMLEAGARGADHLAAIRTLDIRSYMCVPLRVHGRTIGVITLVAGEARRRYGALDLQFAQDLAARAALAVENARAYDEARRANRLKDEFLATLSHELRTPLNAILGYARMLKSGMVAADRLPRAVDIIHKNSAALAKIVEDVLDVSRIVSGKLRLNTQTVDLAPVLALSIETVQPAAEAKQIGLHAVMEPAPAQVVGDPDRLQQVLWNLLSNAVKFTPEGGSVTVRLEAEGGQAILTVTDSGVGIAADILPHVFERFRQGDSRFAREYGGLGLGLAIARHIVEMHGGTIEASSKGVGQGATFQVRLPLARASARAVAPQETADRAPVRSRRLDGVHVLLVDDEADALMMVRELLEMSGARVTTAKSAEEALQRLEEDAPDLLLTDIGMPVVDGFELIRRVRELPRSVRNLPAAALTAYAQPEDRTRALRSGFQVHLAKPIDPSELIDAVETLAGRE